MQNRKIKTKLIGKDELFKVIALGEATRLPILFVGEPGVAKTQTLLDYAASMYNHDIAKVRERCFIIELDEGTKNTEVKGRVNMEDLMINKKYTLDTPIADAEYVLINEVDKGSSAIRNTMLSVMREKALFLGGEIKKCNWKIFAGSCNIIDDNDEDKPFWDRFLLQHEVHRVGSNHMEAIWNLENQEPRQLEINIPDKSDIDNVSIDKDMLEKFIKIVYDSISDRTAAAIPFIAKNIKLIWGYMDDEALMKTCEFIAPKLLETVSNKLEDPDIASIKNKIRQMGMIQDEHALINTVQDIENELSQMSTNAETIDKVQSLKDFRDDVMKKSENIQIILKKMDENAKKLRGQSVIVQETVPGTFADPTKAIQVIDNNTGGMVEQKMLD